MIDRWKLDRANEIYKQIDYLKDIQDKLLIHEDYNSVQIDFGEFDDELQDVVRYVIKCHISKLKRGIEEL